MLLVNAVNTEGRPLEIFVKDGRIAAVGQELEALAGENETVIDAGGLTVLPAFVDLHCHWRTPGFEYKEDIETGSRAAAAGGYTFVNLMPNTKPVCSSAAQAFMVEPVVITSSTSRMCLFFNVSVFSTRKMFSTFSDRSNICLRVWLSVFLMRDREEVSTAIPVTDRMPRAIHSDWL